MGAFARRCPESRLFCRRPERQDRAYRWPHRVRRWSCERHRRRQGHRGGEGRGGRDRATDRSRTTDALARLLEIDAWAIYEPLGASATGSVATDRRSASDGRQDRSDIDLSVVGWDRHIVSFPGVRYSDFLPPYIVIEHFAVRAGDGERHRECPLRIGKIEEDQRNLLRFCRGTGSPAPVGDRTAAEVGVCVEVERLTAAQRAAGSPEPSESSIYADQRLPNVVVEILPMHIAPDLYAGCTRAGKDVVLTEFLTLPEHRYALTGVQRNSVGLRLVEAAAVAEQDILTSAEQAKAADEVAMVVAFDILKRGHGALHAAEVTAGGVSEKGWIEQMGEIIVHELEPRHVIGVVEEVVLPGCV